MADVSKLKLNDVIYDIKDSTARTGLAGKQDTLVSGTNIKTINHQDILGEGNLDIAGGVTGVKGNAEESYRSGNVNLTIANLGVTASTTELNYTTGVTSAIQTQLNNKVSKNTDITAATKCKITYDAKGLVTGGANLDATDIPDLSAGKITSGTLPDERIASAETWNAKVGSLSDLGITASATELNYTKGVTSAIQTQLNGKEPADATILKKANVVDNVTTVTTDVPLSANQGKLLSDRISNLESVGRFLSVLNCSNGTVSSQPTGSVGTTYNYRVGDYFRVGAAGSYEPKPVDTYTIDSTSGSSNFQTGSESYEIGDIIYCSNINTTAHTSTWVKQSGSGGKVQDVQVNGTTIVASGTGIANITADNLPDLPASKITSGTFDAARIPTISGASKLSDWSSKQDVIVFNTTYSATTNKAATMTDIQNAIGNAIAASY